MQRSLILLKPDCVQRRLMGRVIARFEDKGLNFVAMKLMKISPDLAKQHYAEHVEKAWYPTLEEFITGGPIVAAVVEGFGGRPGGSRYAGRNQRAQSRSGNNPRRFQFEPADESRPRQRRRGSGRPGDRRCISSPKNSSTASRRSPAGNVPRTSRMNATVRR